MKKKFFLLLFVFTIFSLNLSAQNVIGCGTKLSKEEQKLFSKMIPNIEAARKAKLANKTAATTYVIPVVFHILSDGSNLKKPFTKAQMKSRIDSAIDVCNKDFNGLYPGYNTTDPRFNSVKSKMDILFVAATIDPDGNLLEIPGMNWHPEAHIVDGYDSKIYDYMYYGKNNKYYLDVVVVDEPNPGQGAFASGHAFLPVQNVVPHVTFNHRYIGYAPGSGSDASFQFAKEMSHEFGHYFGLNHTFEKDCDPINDGMADTPPTTSGFGCNLSAVNSCGVIANYENLMDYNVECQAMFTKDQTNAMTFWLDDNTQAKYSRRALWQTSNLVAVGVNPSQPIANFKVSTTAICPTNTVTFKDVSTGLPVSRLWTFAGGTPATSTLQNPTVTYNSLGNYAVTLKVTNAIGTDTKTISGHIRVGEKATANLVETFSGSSLPSGWLVTNADSGLEWQKKNGVGNGDTSCLMMNNSDNSVVGELDYIQLPYFNFTNAVNSQLFFDVAYTKFDDLSADILGVEVSTNCGASWKSIYSKTHTDLQTADIIKDLSNTWKPTLPSHWRKEVIDLSAYKGQSNVTFRFKNTSGYGTTIYIDNVNVAIVQSETPVSDFSASVTKTNCSTITVPFKDASIGNPTNWAWSFPGGSPATSTAQNPTVTYSSQGKYTVTLKTTNTAGTGTTNSKPNFIEIVTPVTTSFTEGFEGVFPPLGWEIINIKDNLTWEKSTLAGKNSSSAMIMNNADNATGDVDEIILKPLNMSIGVTDLSFDVAYAKFDDKSPDLLEILGSTDCGVTWKKIYSKTHTVLETVVSLAPNDWVPKVDSDWRKENISLSDFKGKSNVLIKFVNTSGYGARIWIDNLKVTFDSKEKPISEFVLSSPMVCKELPVQFSDISIGEPTSWSWSFPGGTPSSSNLKNPSITYATPGVYNVTLTASNAFGQGSTIKKDDFIQVKSKGNLPMVQDFNGVFPVANWEMINIDKDPITWEKRTGVGKGDLSCLIINNADAPEGLIDELILQSLDFTTASKPYFSFDLAYTQYFNAGDANPKPAPDKIDVFVSSDCGVNWINVYSKNQLQLQTVQPPIQDNKATVDTNETNDWIPTKDSDWRKETIDLSAVKNKSNVMLKIRNTSGYGTRVWLDNFRVANTSDLAVIENEIEGVAVYPNPSNGLYALQLPLSDESYQVSVYNTVGQLVLKTTFLGNEKERTTINLLGEPNGIYILKIVSSSKKVFTQKLVKK